MHRIPEWPFLLPLAVITFVVLVARLRRRAALTAPRAVVAAAVTVLLVGVVANSFFPIFDERAAVHVPWWRFLNLTPGRDTDVADMAQNVLVFLPIGFLLPLVTRVRRLSRVVLQGFLLSLVIESLQLLTAAVWDGGHVADVNDLLANTLGAPLGYAVFLLAVRWSPARRLATAATWPSGRPARS